MTTSLRLRLYKYLGGEAAGSGAVANVLALDKAGAREPRRDRRNVVIPAGLNATPLTLEVEPGRYLVEAALPSGDVASLQVSVEEGAGLPVDLVPAHSPHEWLSWQQYLGNVPSRAGELPAPWQPIGASAASGRRSARPALDLMEEWSMTRVVATLSGPPPQAVPPARPSPTVFWIGHPVAALSGLERAHEDAWALLGQKAVRRDPLAALAAQPPPVVARVEHDAEHELARLGRNGPLGPQERDTGGSGPTPRRYVLSSSTSGIVELACVPLPWETETGGPVAVELLVRRDPLPGEATLAMSPRDPNIGPALGYMASGSLANARLLFEQARELLYGKFRNPLAAAAGGYVLTATEQADERQDWQAWVPNLAMWFPWLPDGAIQHGRLLLRHRRGKEDVDLARAALFAAYDRGLPFYSLGLQWLVDGLSLFAARDREARTRLAKVQAVAWRANLQQPFTTIRLSDP